MASEGRILVVPEHGLVFSPRINENSSDLIDMRVLTVKAATSCPSAAEMSVF